MNEGSIPNFRNAIQIKYNYFNGKEKICFLTGNGILLLQRPKVRVLKIGVRKTHCKGLFR